MADVRYLFVALLGLGLNACVPIATLVPPLTDGALITIRSEPGPFCGRCDSVTMTVLSDGRVWIEQGHWAGRYNNWVVERQLERVPVENVVHFRDRLSRFRPHGVLVLTDKPPCETFWNDVDGVRVEWRDGDQTDKLFYNFGCDPETKRAMTEALKSAPGLLGIPKLKMPWGQWAATSPG